MIDPPKFSIIIATHNSAEHIGECVDSILSQSLREIEVIMVDVGSTDGTKDHLAELARADERVTFLADRMGSIGRAKNIALDRAMAPYIMIVEPEDYLHRDALTYIYNEMNGAPEMDMFVCESECFGDASYGRTNADRKKLLDDANNADSRRQEADSRVMRSYMFEHFITYRGDYLKNNDIRHYEQPGYGRQDVAFRFLAMAKGIPLLSVAVQYERRLDAKEARISDERAATDICDEFRELKRRLKEDSGLWWRMRLVFWQAYYERNMLLYERLSDALRSKLSGKMQADIKEAIYNKEFSEDHFDVAVRDEMELLLGSAAEFDRFQKEKIKKREAERAEAVRKEERQGSIFFKDREMELDKLSRESAAHIEETRQKYRLNKKWLMEEMSRDMAPLRLLLGFSADEMGELLGVSASTYKSLESGKKEVSWDLYLALLFLFRFNDRTAAVVDTLGLYPEPLRIRMKRGVVGIYA